MASNKRVNNSTIITTDTAKITKTISDNKHLTLAKFSLCFCECFLVQRIIYLGILKQTTPSHLLG